MGYLNEDGLARYDGLIKNWTTFKSGTVDGIDPLLNWQKTSTAGAVTFYPLPTAPIDPVVNFAFTETGPASGEKGPDNPSTITGVSTITVTRCETMGVDETQYTIDLNGTYYGGSVDLSAGTMTVTSSGEYLSTFISFYLSQTNTVSFIAKTSFQHKGNVSSGFASNRFNYGDYNIDSEHVRQGGSPTTGGKDVIVFIDKTRLDLSAATDPDNPTNAEWLAAANTWLSSNPVFFVSQLFTPLTVSLTPLQIYSLSQADPYTPRINTVYSDQMSIQVGYPKSPLATSTELTNAIISIGSNL